MGYEVLEGDARELEIASKEAYSIQNMAAHGADGRSITYIGAMRRQDITYWFWIDGSGCYWYQNSIDQKYDRIAEKRKKRRFAPDSYVRYVEKHYRPR